MSIKSSGTVAFSQHSLQQSHRAPEAAYRKKSRPHGPAFRDSETTTGYAYIFFSMPLSLLVLFFALVFFILFMDPIEPLSVLAGPVTLVWLVAGAAGLVSFEVWADADTIDEKPIAVAQIEARMVFRMEASR
jgi:hypothetical protein